MQVQLIWHIQVDDNLKAASNYQWRYIWLLCAFLQSYALSVSFLLPSRKKKYFSSSASSLSPMRNNSNPESSQFQARINAALYSASTALSSQQEMLRDSRQPAHRALLGWGLITIPNKTESNRQFISSSRQHLNTNCGSEWWIKHVLYQIFFLHTNGG